MKKKLKLPFLKKGIIWQKNTLPLTIIALAAVLLLIFGYIFFSSRINPKNFILDKKAVQSDAQGAVQKCSNNSRWRYCYGEEIGKTVQKKGFAYGVEVLNKVEDLDLKTRDCHLISHKIASEGVAKNPAKWFEIFEFVDQDICSGGFVHGAMEGRMRFDTSFEINETTIPGICETIRKTTDKENDDPCAHVLGHILLAEKNGSIEDSLAVCQKLAKNYKSSCLNGMFMENITRDNLAEHEVAPHIDFNEANALEIEKLCASQLPGPAESCWREISHLYVNLANWDPDSVYKYCQKASSEKNVDICYLHTFNEIVIRANLSQEQMEGLCRPYLENTQKLGNCMSRVVRMMLTNTTKLLDRASNFCLSFNIEGNRINCYKRIGRILSEITSREAKETLCRRVPEKYINSCLSMEL